MVNVEENAVTSRGEENLIDELVSDNTEDKRLNHIHRSKQTETCVFPIQTPFLINKINFMEKFSEN